MPPRLVSLLLLVYWCIAAFYLLTREVVPELSLGYPPDLRAIAAASDGSGPARWTIEVDNPRDRAARSIGQAMTSSRRLSDGWFEMETQVRFDAGELLKGTPLGLKESVKLQLESRYRIDPAGNLRSFELRVTQADSKDLLCTVSGYLRNQVMEVVSKGPVPLLNQTLRFPYEPRSVVQDALGPIDRLPGLQLGQRWDSQVVNPFTGQVERVRVEVARRTLLHWAGEPVSAFEVEQHAKALTARTWVRPDGLIIRQEVPLPLVRLVLERVPPPRPRFGEGGEP